ncbi:MAG: hypothetical protein ISS71_06075 [Phycisphaerae bacterium]|nr:hypothetical protein [Phycisphaerae bacterium]
MKRSVLGLLVVVAAMSVNVTSFAMDGIGVDVSADFYNKYVWRGQVLNDDYAFQPGINITFDKFTAGIWGSLDMTDYGDNSGEFTEIDYSLDYTKAILESVDLSVGVIHYYFPSGEDTTEVYWGFAFDLPLSPSVTVYHDVDDVKGTYVSVGVGHSIEKIAELCPETPIGMEISASLGWGSESYNKTYWNNVVQVDESALNDLAVSVAFPVVLGNWTVTPSFNYVTLMDSEVRKSDAYNGTSSDYFFTGISLSTSF